MSNNSGVKVLVISNHSPDYSLNCNLLSPITVARSYSWLTNRTPAWRPSDFANHSYDYRTNCIPLSPITITNRLSFRQATFLLNERKAIWKALQQPVNVSAKLSKCNGKKFFDTVAENIKSVIWLKKKTVVTKRRVVLTWQSRNRKMTQEHL